MGGRTQIDKNVVLCYKGWFFVGAVAPDDYFGFF
jgi:hypothetical protein